MDKDFILAEIKRTAEKNGGAPLGHRKFAQVTGIREHDWKGKHWIRWGDALTEAGYQRNKFQVPFDEGQLLGALALLARELSHFPLDAELRIKARQDETFPSSRVFARLGKKAERVRKVLDYCGRTPGFNDVAAICRVVLSDGWKHLRRQQGRIRRPNLGSSISPAWASTTRSATPARWGAANTRSRSSCQRS